MPVTRPGGGKPSAREAEGRGGQETASRSSLAGGPRRRGPRGTKRGRRRARRDRQVRSRSSPARGPRGASGRASRRASGHAVAAGLRSPRCRATGGRAHPSVRRRGASTPFWTGRRDGRSGRGIQCSAALLAHEVVRQGEDPVRQLPVSPDGSVGGELGEDDVEELPGVLVDDEGVVDELSVPALDDEPDTPEGGEVLGGGGPRDVEDSRDLADAELVPFEGGEDSQTCAVCEDLRDVEEAGEGRSRHFASRRNDDVGPPGRLNDEFSSFRDATKWRRRRGIPGMEPGRLSGRRTQEDSSGMICVGPAPAGVPGIGDRRHQVIRTVRWPDGLMCQPGRQPGFRVVAGRFGAARNAGRSFQRGPARRTSRRRPP